MTKKILREYETTTRQFLELLSTFKPGNINVVPFEGSWTAAQLGEHIFRSDAKFLEVLTGPAIQTERKPDEKVKGIRDVFLDFNTKLKNPDFNAPSSGKDLDRETLIDSLKEKKEKITDVIKTKDLSETCTNFELPQMGKLTRMEWIYIDIYHTQRHTHQLKNIFEKVTEKVKNK